MYAQMDSPSSITTDISRPRRAHSAESSRNTIRAEVRYAPSRASMERPSRNSPAPRRAMRTRVVPGGLISCSRAVVTPAVRFLP